jgi:hypothetical protein
MEQAWQYANKYSTLIYMSDELTNNETFTLMNTLVCSPNTPLWQRAPTKDQEGTRLSDFMMIIPKLKKRSSEHRRYVLDALIEVLQRYEDVVVFADLNLKINVLWVSVRPVKGVCLEIPAAIKVAVPEALLVADNRSGNAQIG